MTHPHADSRTPFWTVYAVCDPDGEGADFSYTVGLHERGVPELWMAARPSLGDDPGLDWKFSQADTCSLLNELAWDWLGGCKKIGDTFEREFDEGFVTARFQIDQPDDVERLEALHVERGATVVPIRWSLHRQPVGPNAPLVDHEWRLAVLRFGQLTLPFPEGLSAPSEIWATPDVLTFDPLDRWGPRTPLIQGFATYFWTCEPDQLLNLIRLMIEIDGFRRFTWPLASIRSAARVAGRGSALDRLEEDIEGMLDLYLPGILPRALRLLGRNDKDEIDFIRVSCGRILRVGLGAELVADFISEDVRLHSLGLLVANRFPPGVPAGAEWYAGPAVVTAVDDLLRRAGPDRMFEICRRHVQTTSAQYLRIIDRLEAMNNSTACSWSPANGVIDDDFVRAVERAGRARGWEGYLPMQGWASLVAALLTHRPLLTTKDVNAFARPFRSLLPGLTELVNNPC